MGSAVIKPLKKRHSQAKPGDLLVKIHCEPNANVIQSSDRSSQVQKVSELVHGESFHLSPAGKLQGTLNALAYASAGAECKNGKINEEPRVTEQASTKFLNGFTSKISETLRDAANTAEPISPLSAEPNEDITLPSMSTNRLPLHPKVNRIPRLFTLKVNKVKVDPATNVSPTINCKKEESRSKQSYHTSMSLGNCFKSASAQTSVLRAAVSKILIARRQKTNTVSPEHTADTVEAPVNAPRDLAEKDNGLEGAGEPCLRLKDPIIVKEAGKDLKNASPDDHDVSRDARTPSPQYDNLEDVKIINPNQSSVVRIPTSSHFESSKSFPDVNMAAGGDVGESVCQAEMCTPAQDVDQSTDNVMLAKLHGEMSRDGARERGELLRVKSEHSENNTSRRKLRSSCDPLKVKSEPLLDNTNQILAPAIHVYTNSSDSSANIDRISSSGLAPKGDGLIHDTNASMAKAIAEECNTVGSCDSFEDINIDSALGTLGSNRTSLFSLTAGKDASPPSETEQDSTSLSHPRVDQILESDKALLVGADEQFAWGKGHNGNVHTKTKTSDADTYGCMRPTQAEPQRQPLPSLLNTSRAHIRKKNDIQYGDCSGPDCLSLPRVDASRRLRADSVNVKPDTNETSHTQEAYPILATNSTLKVPNESTDLQQSESVDTGLSSSISEPRLIDSHTTAIKPSAVMNLHIPSPSCSQPCLDTTRERNTLLAPLSPSDEGTTHQGSPSKTSLGKQARTDLGDNNQGDQKGCVHHNGPSSTLTTTDRKTQQVPDDLSRPPSSTSNVRSPPPSQPPTSTHDSVSTLGPPCEGVDTPAPASSSTLPGLRTPETKDTCSREGMGQDIIDNIQQQLHEEGLKPTKRDGGVAFFIPVTEDGLQPSTTNTDITERLTKSKKCSLTYEERMILANSNRQVHLSKKREFAIRDVRNAKSASGASSSSSSDVTERNKVENDLDLEFDL